MASLAFIGLLVAHFVLHWEWVLCMSKGGSQAPLSRKRAGLLVLGTVLSDLHRLDEAERSLLTAQGLFRKVELTDHEPVHQLEYQIGVLRYEQGKLDEAAAIMRGQDTDVIEIDAASNTGVDNVRELIEGVRLAPSSYAYKVIIFDEVHMLSKGAFNALLKTLEEPPSHAIFILATTEYDKVPATIASRCQRFHFRKLALEQIIEKLKGIVTSEKIKISDDALELVAALGEGSLRDAESLLSQITSLKEDVTLETVEKHLGKLGFNRVSGLADLIMQNNLKACLTRISEINEGGYNVTDLTKELIHYLRRVLTLKYNPDLEAEFKKELTTKELELVKSHAKVMDDKKHIPLLKALIVSYSQMRYSPFASIPLEIALIEHLRQ
jgi:DNA polymerase-3 subunit gamma/tau